MPTKDHHNCFTEEDRVALALMRLDIDYIKKRIDKIDQILYTIGIAIILAVLSAVLGVVLLKQ